MDRKEKLKIYNNYIAKQRQGFVRWALRNNIPLVKAKSMAVKKFRYAGDDDILAISFDGKTLQ